MTDTPKDGPPWPVLTEEELKAKRAKDAKQQADRADRRRRVCELKLQGLTFDQIARAMDFKNKSTPYRIWVAAMADIPKVAQDTMRKQYEQRTDRVIRKAFDLFTAKDPKIQLQAAQLINDTEASRAKVLGFAEPTQLRHGGAKGAPPVAVTAVSYGDLAGMTDAELADAREALARSSQATASPAAAAGDGPGDGAPPSGSDQSG